MSEGQLARELNKAIPLRDKLGRIADLLEKSGVDLDEVGRVRKVRLGEHQVAVKRKLADGTDIVEVHDLAADSLEFLPKWADGPAWPVVQPARPCVVRAPKVKPRRPQGGPDVLVLPDAQIGYRLHDDGELDPFHDEQALSVAVQAAAMLQPARIVILGDTLDLPAWSRFLIEPAFQRTTQPALDRAHRWLAELRAAAPDAAIDLLEGNHDARLARGIITNAKEAFGLRRANAPESWPVLSIPFLLRLDELDVRYIDGYPACELWLADDLVAVHGERLRVERVLQDEQVSVLQGHTHHAEVKYRTRRTARGRVETWAASVGCLSRVDGAVPSTKGGTDSRGRAKRRYEDWQQAMALVWIGEPGFHDVDLVRIRDGRARILGQQIEAPAVAPDDRKEPE